MTYPSTPVLSRKIGREKFCPLFGRFDLAGHIRGPGRTPLGPKISRNDSKVRHVVSATKVSRHANPARSRKSQVCETPTSREISNASETASIGARMNKLRLARKGIDRQISDARKLPMTLYRNGRDKVRRLLCGRWPRRSGG